MIVKEYEPSQDDICVWHKFLATYRFGGKLSLYIDKQQEILTKHYHLHYPGGANGFVDDYEEAFMNIDYVLRDQADPELQRLYTDSGKRETDLHQEFFFRESYPRTNYRY